MASASTSGLSATTTLPLMKCRTHRSTQVVRAISYRDEGISKDDIVETKLHVLRERMEEVRVKERLERCCLIHDQHGWDYAKTYDSKCKRDRHLKQCREVFELIALVGTTFGITVLGGSLCLCLASMLLHFS